VTGVKHINAVIACHTLGNAYLATKKPAEVGLAVSLLIQADKIGRRVGDDDKDRALSMWQSMRQDRQLRLDSMRGMS